MATVWEYDYDYCEIMITFFNGQEIELTYIWEKVHESVNFNKSHKRLSENRKK